MALIPLDTGPRGRVGFVQPVNGAGGFGEICSTSPVLTVRVLHLPYGNPREQ